jgi:MraZ protein
MVFRGGPVLTLDGKGRITVPARWREQLMPDPAVSVQLIVAKNPDGCLSLYPMDVWEKVETEVLGLTSEHDAWRRILMGSATEVEIDSGSRVLIPPELRSWARLERDVKFMGVGPHFELWDMARYEEREAQAIAAGRPEPLRNLVIR